MKVYKQIDCFSRHLKFFKLLGIYPLDIGWPFYALYSKIIIGLLVVLCDVLSTINFYFLPRHLDNFVEEMILYFTLLSVLSKALTFCLNRDKIKHFLIILESDMFQPVSDKEIQIIDCAKKFNLRYWMIMSVVSLTSHFFHVVMPVIVHVVFNAELSLPICSYSFLSYEMKQSLIYPVYIYQTLSVNFGMMYNINIDTFFLGLMMFVIAQLEILEEKLGNVTEDVIASNEINFQINFLTDMKTVLKLNQAIVHYDEVAKFCSLIQDVFSITLFVQFSIASCIICVCLFRLTKPAPYEYYMFLSTYMSIMVIQILLPCWFGTRIMDKSRLLAQAIYSCDWTPRSKPFKSNIRLFVERAHRPISITGGKMFLLSLITFTSIMNSAYSFFTLLNNVQSR